MSRINFCASTVLTTIMAGVVLSAWAQQRSEDQSNLGRLSPVDLAIEIVKSGGAAGIVAELPSSLGPKLARLKAQSQLAMTDRSAFTAWVEHRTAARPSVVVPRSPAGLLEYLREYLAHRPEDWSVTSARGATVAILKSSAAVACNRALQRTLRSDVEGRSLDLLVSDAVRAATDARVPRGFVGTCMAASQLREEPLRLAAGEALEDALTAVAQNFGGIVWVAVHAGDECSLGLVSQSVSGGACMLAITDDLLRQAPR